MRKSTQLINLAYEIKFAILHYYPYILSSSTAFYLSSPRCDYFTVLSKFLWFRGLGLKQPRRNCCPVRLFTVPKRSDFSLVYMPVYITMINLGLICQQ